MKIQHLMEGAEPKMPGAPSGIQIMTPQQFVAKAGDMPGQSDWRDMTYNPSKGPKFSEKLDKMKEDDEQGVAEGLDEAVSSNYLYHATGGLKEILQSGAIDAARSPQDSTKAQTKLPTVSTTRDWGYASGSNATAQSGGISRGAVIVLDRNAVEQRYKTLGTSQSRDNRGLAFPKAGNLKAGQDARSYDTDQSGTLTKADADDVFAKGTINSFGKPASRQEVGQQLGQAKHDYYTPKAGGEFEEAVVVPKGSLPIQGTMVGFWVNPRGPLAKDPAIMNDPRRLDMVRPNQFVKAKQEQGVAEGVRDLGYDAQSLIMKLRRDVEEKRLQPTREAVLSAARELAGDMDFAPELLVQQVLGKGVAEGLEQLNRIRKLSGLAEATTLPASTRDLKGQEFQDYMNRIKGTDDIDKKTGQVKLDKKGNEKYVSGKTKSDKYKMPYIHRSSIIEYLGPDGKTYDEDKIKQSLSQRPKALLKQNEKMKHSNGEFEQFFNVGFAALTGIAVDESTDNLIIVNTCPGAGSCKVDCFAMKGGKVQFKAAWQSDGRILTYLLNDPSGFFNQLSAEISKEEAAGKKGDKKFPNGWQTTVRWHDAGDFFSPEYLDMALKMAAKHPDVKFYAYTKMAGAALAQKPPNFIINWSEGANTSQEKQVKAKDANLDTTKNSRIVPDDLFQDLLVKDEKKNLVKGASGQWQVQPDKLPELKQRLASEYGLSANSILSYDEYMAKRKSIPAGMKYNVIVAPGEGDISANDQNIISTLLLRH